MDHSHSLPFLLVDSPSLRHSDAWLSVVSTSGGNLAYKRQSIRRPKLQSKMDHSAKEKEAIALVAEADKKIKSPQGFLGTLFG